MSVCSLRQKLYDKHVERRYKKVVIDNIHLLENITWIMFLWIVLKCKILYLKLLWQNDPGIWCSDASTAWDTSDVGAHRRGSRLCVFYQRKTCKRTFLNVYLLIYVRCLKSLKLFLTAKITWCFPWFCRWSYDSCFVLVFTGASYWDV